MAESDGAEEAQRVPEDPDDQGTLSTCYSCGDGMFSPADLEDGLCLHCASTPEDERGMA